MAKRKQPEGKGPVQRSIASFFVQLSRPKSDTSQAAAAPAANEATPYPEHTAAAAPHATAYCTSAGHLQPPSLRQFAFDSSASPCEITRAAQHEPASRDTGSELAGPVGHGKPTTSSGLPAQPNDIGQSVDQQHHASMHGVAANPSSCVEAAAPSPSASPTAASAAAEVVGHSAGHGHEAPALNDKAAVPGAPPGATQAGDGTNADAASLEAKGAQGPAAALVVDGERDEGSGASPREPGLETDYERARAERIRRNMEVMRSMGLGDTHVSPRQSQKRRSAPRRTSAVAAPVERSYPLRSRRGSSANAAAAEDCKVSDYQAAAEGEQPGGTMLFDDSSVLRYVCEASWAPAGSSEAAGSGCSGWGGEAPEGAQVVGFTQLPGTLADPALARAYSVDWRPGLVVAGGKDGQVSIFGSRQVEAGNSPALEEDGGCLPPLLSARLHKGWVADVQFVRGPQQSDCLIEESHAAAGCPSAESSGASSLLLLTAGNDGTLCLWDVARSAAQGPSMQPLQLASCKDLHSGGIFSMQEVCHRVLTASKDCTVAVSLLGAEGTAGSANCSSSGSTALRLLRRYEELHEGVVKCARWRDGVTFASCGNDRAICVVDTRQAEDAASYKLADAHSTAINCLRWHPSGDHLLLSTSHDPHILLHDLRQPSQPLILGIYQPTFVWGGAGIATGGEKSSCLSLYCTATGSTLSRGEVDFTVGATFCGPGRQDPLVCTASRAVYMLGPTWRTSA
ncbi:hypothetical protein N2152v2_004421 [Parachlorella kessleri]